MDLAFSPPGEPPTSLPIAQAGGPVPRSRWELVQEPLRERVRQWHMEAQKERLEATLPAAQPRPLPRI